MSFLKNTWYVAGHAHELDAGLVSRKICNEQIVMFRTSAGEIAALHDRCPHRFVPLSLGKRVDDTLQCAYHGLCFGADGACVAAPNEDDAQRARISVKSYVTVERYAVIWLWMGQAQLADPTTIPDFGFLSDERFGVSRGYSHIKGNFQMISDNLLDLSHVHFLHPSVHEGSEFSNFTNKVRLEQDTVWSMLWRHHYHLDEARQKLYGMNAEDVEGQGHCRWNAPSVLLIHTAFWEHGKTVADGVELPNAHLLTPETEFTTHYFWASGRTFDIHNAVMTTGTEVMMKTVFENEDGPMIEAQQAQMGNITDFLEHKPIILQADAAGVMARRVLKRMIKQESVEDDALSIAAE